MILLITGGVKSGKSSRALELARGQWPFPVSFIATAEVLDEEMRLRITRHREERARLGSGKGEGFITIEEPLELDKAIRAAGPRAVVDCIPMWINNLMYYKREADFPAILEGFIRGMEDCIVVTNETGLGNIPFDETTRRYNLLLAEANRKIAAAADVVEFMVSGIPLKVKG
ncbi:MAG: bifunctional adenosylcobinamide kinase/adenosylcobinamide-phosphate guanylyltransferase [Treponema sp.]|jgi:adenosylcobinamide kinase/adenosylcobinamide-phosphate guanylyltransferase|nr:bifunctional adenosylcobinamide kinase/adenosylcobinamide-phosphate guanylyltransferase [Treponema sp.]